MYIKISRPMLQATLNFDDFTYSHPKETGRTPGFFATNNTDNTEYLFKETPVSLTCEYTLNPAVDVTKTMIRTQFLQEYITSPLFQLLLPGRSSSFELVYKAGSTTILYGCSKLLSGFISLYSYKPYPASASFPEGFEEVIAASLFAGELDYHGDNIGVIEEDESQYLVMAKIDHGLAATNFHSDEITLRQQLATKFKEFFYSGIPFRIEKFRDAIIRMLSITDDTITDIVYSRIANLEKAGFDFAAFTTVFHLDGAPERFNAISTTHLQEFYADALIEQKHELYHLVSTLNIFNKIKYYSPVSFTTLIEEDPIKFAYLECLEIDGLPALYYAMREGLPIGRIHPFTFLRDRRITIQGKDPMKVCIDGKIEVKSTPLLLEEIIFYYDRLIKRPDKFEFTANELTSFFKKVQREVYPKTHKLNSYTSYFVKHAKSLPVIDISLELASITPYSNIGWELSATTLISHYSLEALNKMQSIVMNLPRAQVNPNSIYAVLEHFSDYVCTLLTLKHKCLCSSLQPILLDLRALATKIQPLAEEENLYTDLITTTTGLSKSL